MIINFNAFIHQEFGEKKLLVMQGFLNAIPGIIIQLILISLIMYKLKKMNVMKITLDDGNQILMVERKGSTRCIYYIF